MMKVAAPPERFAERPHRIGAMDEDNARVAGRTGPGARLRALVVALVVSAALAPLGAAAATITASPNPVLAPTGIGSTTIIWDARDAGFGEIWVSVDGGPEIPMAAGPRGSQPVPWIQRGHTYAFRLYAGAGHASVLASTVVTAGAMLYASPAPVASVTGLAPTAITWDTGGAGHGEVRGSMNGGPELPFAAGSRGTQAAPWIQAGAVYVFTLYAGGAPAASIQVRAGPSLTASPNPVITQGGPGTAVISWNTGSGAVGQVWASVNGAEEVPFAQDASGAQAAPWITPGANVRFTLFEGFGRGVRLASTTVNGAVPIGLRLTPALIGFQQPLFLTHAGDRSGDLFVVEKVGRIRRVVAGRATVFADLTPIVGSAGGEQGLLGLAFHPGYAFNRQLFVNYTDTAGNTVIARYTAFADGSAVAPGSEDVILRVAQPAANHNGGWLAFGPEGALYAALGDGGGAGDQFGNAQNGGSLLGKILRLDVDSARPYAIPPSNPFVGVAGFRGEIWALGLRNPWRPSFDRIDGHLYIADVGQQAREEIDFEPQENRGGNNYGWPHTEGAQCFPDPNAVCDRPGLVPPVLDYPHTGGAQSECSVTGGYVYRGSAFPLLRGAYFFGDFCSGRIWTMRRRADGGFEKTQVLQMPLLNDLSSFGEDEAAELYAIGIADNAIYRIVPAP
jgi:glucose/arabinose dehydrogenase